MLITFMVLAFTVPCMLCFWRYYMPCADEKYKIEGAKYMEAKKRKKESKKASRKASKELAAQRKARKNSSTFSG